MTDPPHEEAAWQSAFGVREISNEEGDRLLRIVRRSTGSVVTWRRAQMVLLSVQAMDVSQIAKVTFTGPDWVRDVIHNFNADGGEGPDDFQILTHRQAA